VVESHQGERGFYLSCYVVPAIFQFQHNPNYKYQSEFYSVTKNGYVVFDFIEISKSGESQANSKRSFVLTMTNVRKFLDVDPDYRMKVYRRPGQEVQADEEDLEGDDGDEVVLNF
jgi:hypothetical protein